jgi:hypothetical protein
MARCLSGALLVVPMKGRWRSSIANQYTLFTVKITFFVGAHANTSSSNLGDIRILAINWTSA